MWQHARAVLVVVLLGVLAGCSGKTLSVSGSPSSHAGASGSGSGAGGTTGTGGAGVSDSGAAPAAGGGAGADGGHAPAHIGEACDVNADCAAPLVCHYDPTDYIADRQCAAACTSDTQCQAKFGAGTVCTQVGLCLPSCTTNADCPDKTICNPLGWCQRTGAGSGIPYCDGLANPCLPSTCSTTVGCKDESYCDGTAVNCLNFTDATYCALQAGCWWWSGYCVDSSKGCSSFTSSDQCRRRGGCNWHDSCTGSAVACDQMSVSTCATQSGCSVQSPPVCTPGAVQCDATQEHVISCSADGLEAKVLEDCTASGQLCGAGACSARACKAGTHYCSGNEYRYCNADGTDYTVAFTCAADQWCDETKMACNQHVCSPNQPLCWGNTATLCSADGNQILVNQGTDCTPRSCINGICTANCTPGATQCKTGTDVLLQCSTDGTDWLTQRDCSQAGQVCISDACVPVVCPAGQLFCDGASVMSCSAKGESSTVSKTCPYPQYCSTASLDCVRPTCYPSAPACNGNVPTKCASDGSGLVAGGTDCGSLTCLDGRCISPIFAEDFEDGDYAGWTVVTDHHSYAVNAGAAASGSRYGVELDKLSNPNDGWDGLAHPLNLLQPSAISWWMDSAAGGGTVALMSNLGYPDCLVYVYFGSTFNLNQPNFSDIVRLPYAGGGWYHVELRNIDWTARTFDYYVDDVLEKQGAQFTGSGTSIGEMDLFVAQGGSGYFDEIVFAP